MHRAYLLTGSNIGNSLLNLEKARACIQAQIGKVEMCSSVYRTEPWGNREQQLFFNQVLLVLTEFMPHQLMNTILGIEHDMGRNRHTRWEPRIIDIDILFYDDLIVNDEGLTIPHPLLHERRFTLVPLAAIASGLVHPVLHRTVSQLLSDCPDHGAVEKL